MSDDPRSLETSSTSASPSPGAEAFEHTPVMEAEIVALLSEVPPGVFVDATLGGAGHALAILSANPGLDLLGIDRDADALSAATAQLAALEAARPGRTRLERARFDQLPELLRAAGVERLSGFLFDLGVSSPQLDRAERGFSFRQDGPLDMRMDTDAPLSAADVVNNADERELATILRRNGDERFATRIARAIVAQRPFSSTTELSETVVASIPAAARRKGGHPAKRTFQALRIHVNDELTILRPTLEAAVDALAIGGRGLVLTYHSGEDRIVKDVFRGRSTVDIPPGIPVPATEPEFTVLRPLSRRPGDDEIARNRRAASARLRGIERTAVAA